MIRVHAWRQSSAKRGTIFNGEGLNRSIVKVNIEMNQGSFYWSTRSMLVSPWRTFHEEAIRSISDR